VFKGASILFLLENVTKTWRCAQMIAIIEKIQPVVPISQRCGSQWFRLTAPVSNRRRAKDSESIPCATASAAPPKSQLT